MRRGFDINKYPPEQHERRLEWERKAYERRIESRNKEFNDGVLKPLKIVGIIFVIKILIDITVAITGFK